MLGNLSMNPPDETQPWTICITKHADAVPVHVGFGARRIYKMTLDGRIVGVLGESGRGPNQLNWIHGLACPSEDLLYVADMNNWRVQRVQLRPGRNRSTAAR